MIPSLKKFSGLLNKNMMKSVSNHQILPKKFAQLKYFENFHHFTFTRVFFKDLLTNIKLLN